MATGGENEIPLEDKQNIQEDKEQGQEGKDQHQESKDQHQDGKGQDAEGKDQDHGQPEAEGAVSHGRPLQCTEMFYEMMQAQAKVSIYIHIAVFKSRVPLEESVIRKSLQLLSKFQPLLHMKIVKEKNENGQDIMRYSEIEGDDFIALDTIRISDTSAWVDICTREINFDSEKGPLWKAILGHVDTEQAADTDDDKVHSAVMVFFFHHAIIDAKGGVDLIYRQFLPILNGILENGDLSAYETPLAVAAPFEDHFLPEKDRNKSAPWYTRLIMTFLRWKNRHSSKVEKPMIRSTEEKYTDTTEASETPIIPFIYSEELTEKIIKASKANGVTVHMTIMTALSHVASTLCREQGISKPPKVLAHNITVDLRRKLNFETPQPMGIYVGAIMPKMKVAAEKDVEKDRFWITAKNYGKEMKKLMQGDKYLKSTVGIYKYILDSMKAEQRPLSEILNEFGINFELSVANLGNLDEGVTPSGNTVELVEQYSNLVLSGVRGDEKAPCTLLFFVSTFRGKLTWLMNYIPNWISRDFACKFVTCLEDLLKRVCSPDETRSENAAQGTAEANQAEPDSKEEADDVQKTEQAKSETKEEASKQDTETDQKAESAEPETKQDANAKADNPSTSQDAMANEAESNQEAMKGNSQNSQEVKKDEPENSHDTKADEPESK